jgi:hypothetical protein
MLSTFPKLLSLVLALSLAGCASSRIPELAQTPRNGNLLTQQEIQKAHYTNVFEAVAALRSNWMAPRPPISISDPNAGRTVVFTNGSVYLGGLSNLRLMHVTAVEALEYLNPREATARFGIRSNGGPAIVVISSAGS